MKQFLSYGHVLTPEEIEAHADEGVPENPPTLDMFKEQVYFYYLLLRIDVSFAGQKLVFGTTLFVLLSTCHQK